MSLWHSGAETDVVIDLPVSVVAALPVDQLGLAILSDLVATSDWNEYNYMLAAQMVYRGDALEAVAEAMTWLRARALTARTPGQSSDAAIFVIRTGKRVLADGPKAFYANEDCRGEYIDRSKHGLGHSSSSANTSRESSGP